MPTLARLSFWVSPERMDTFEATYKKKLVPLLKKHNLEESSERGRSTVEGVFSRLFEVKTPSEVAVGERVLRRDPVWQEGLQKLGTIFGTTQPEGLLGYHFGLYRTPAGPGKTVDAGPGFRQGVWQSFNVQDGLPASSITDILQDREGRLWFGTGRGVSCYDGAQFTTFTAEDGLVHNNVVCILEDREGVLWFGTQGGGVSRYDGKEFTTFTAEDDLAHNHVRSLLEDREGVLWFGTGHPCGTLGGGVSRYDGAHRSDGGEFVTFTTEDGLAHNTVNSMVEDREGHLWFGTGSPCKTLEGGVSRYDGKKFVTFTTQDGLVRNTVNSMVEDREGNLWFGTYGGGVSRYSTPRADGAHRPDSAYRSDRGEFVTFALPPYCVLSTLEDREGHLWFGTQGGGVSRYSTPRADGAHRPDGAYRSDRGEFVTFTTDDGLGSNNVWSMLEDQEGVLWFGTQGGGVSRYDGVQFATFTTREGLVKNVVMSILEDREGRLWAGTHEGVCWYDGVQFTTLDGLAGKDVWHIVENKEGDLWFGTFGSGVSRYDGEKVVTFTTEDGLADNRVTAIAEDREGHLWFGIQGGGVSRYEVRRADGAHRPDGEQFVTFTTEDGLASNNVHSILEDREGVLWFGTEDGVTRYDPSPIKSGTSSGGTGERFVTFTTEDGLASNKVHSILEDREGHLWFGTEEGGVSRYDPSASSGGTGKEFVSFTTEDGLAHNCVLSVFEDREGVLWFGTYGGGVSRYDGLVFQHLSRKDGLVLDAVQQILQDRNGDMWIATDGGITRYRPCHTFPGIRLRDVVADRRYGPVKEIRLPVSQKLLAFEFQGRSLYTRPDGMAYVVRLKGHDPNWKPNYTGRAEYQDLPLGEYTFQVKAVDRDLNYSEPATVCITVEPDARLEAFAEALRGTSEEFVGQSEALRRVQEQVTEVAPTDMTVLISGDTGTGKGLAARTIHGLSPRKAGPFIPILCGAIPENLVESELFGHERGAFTGALVRKLGKVELAEGGTLFLDEIGDLAMIAQGKLLRFLEQRTFERVGGTETLQVDVRVIAATNRDLKQMVEAGGFREDLYFRLQGFEVALPPLRERREDIRLLANYFIERMASHLDKEVTHLTPEALSLLQAYDWPGNVRELEHAVQRGVIVCPGSAIRAEDIAGELVPGEGGGTDEILTLEELERRHIRAVLEQTGWVIAGSQGAAARLGLPRSTLQSRMKKLGIVRPQGV